MGPDLEDDLAREVYGVFGMPVDLSDLPGVLRHIRAAADRRRPFLLSTPNLNFLVQSHVDGPFRDALLESDLCPPDGMPIVWLSRLLGADVRERVAGSDIFSALKSGTGEPRPIRVFLFGGQEGVAEKACELLNARATGMACVGWLDPGFADVEAMSTDAILSAINASGADLLSVSLGAQKGQAWLIRSHIGSRCRSGCISVPSSISRPARSREPPRRCAASARSGSGASKRSPISGDVTGATAGSSSPSP